VAVALFGLLFQYVFEKKIILGSETNGAYKVNRIISQTNPDEIPIFGASQAQGGIIPDILGKNYFNYGVDGVGNNVPLFFVKEECKKKKKSPLMIVYYEISVISHSIGDVSYYLYNANYEPVKELMGKNFKTYFNIPFLKYYGQYETYLRNYLNDRVNLTKYTNHGAAIEKNRVTRERFDEMVKEREKQKPYFLSDTVVTNDFFRVIEANPNRIFVIILGPYHKSCFHLYQDSPETKELISHFRREKNVRLIDLSMKIYPDEYFINTTHVHYDGAVAISKEIRDSIATIKLNQ